MDQQFANALSDARVLLGALSDALDAGEASAESGTNEPTTSGEATDEGSDAVLPQLVSLQDMATLVRKSKSTLERHKCQLPAPKVKVKPGSGKADLWDWAEVRPALESIFARLLPQRYPDWNGRD